MKITDIKAEEAYSDRGTIGVQVYVKTTDGAVGKALCSEDLTVGRHEYPLPLDGGTRLNGKGLRGVADYINGAAAVLLGMDVQNQVDCDTAIRNRMDWGRMGAIGAAALSEAILKAGAKERGWPLYRSIRDMDRYKLPVPTYVAAMGSTRYGDYAAAGGKPSYSFAAYGYPTFSEAVYGLWETVVAFVSLLSEALGFKIEMDSENMIPKNSLQNDDQILALMHRAIQQAGQEKHVGIAIDVGADHFYHAERGCYHGLLADREFTREELIAKMADLSRQYPVILLQDPLHADDFEGYAEVTRSGPATVFGNELFVSRLDRLKCGLAENACDGIAVVPAHLGTISEAREVASYAAGKGLRVCTYGTRSEDIDAGDYAVGLGCDVLMGCGISFLCNRMLEIERELGPAAEFVGSDILKPDHSRVEFREVER